MRHFIANIATYAIAALLVTGAAVFAWIRSAQVVITDEATALAQYEPQRSTSFEWQELGALSYERNCMNCHGRNGEGWDQYPALGHSARLFAAPGGREYLIDLHLYGLTSDRWGAPMPPMGHMRDVELAASLNHLLTNFGNRVPQDARLFVPQDIAARRGLSLTPWQVDEKRQQVAGSR